MSDIKKKYNHFSIESEFLKTNYFHKLYSTKKNTKREKVITQLPIEIDKDMPREAMSGIIRESVIATYQIMNGKKTKLLPIFDTQNKNLTTENYENILTKAGIFFGIDIDNIVYSERNTNFVRNLFVELVKEKNIYEDCSINYRSIDEQKTLGSDEIQQKLTKTKEYNIRYFVDTKNISLIVPTLWPETLFADVALAVHPEDKRYKKLIKNKVIIPIVNKAIPIIGDESVDPTKGTGIIRITPAHDAQSLLIAQKHELKTDNFAIDKKWDFTEHAGDFKGKPVKEFVKNIIKNLDDIHNLESTTYREVPMVFSKKTWEKARPLLCNQLFINIQQEPENIQQAIQEGHLLCTPHNEECMNIVSTIQSRPVTKEDSRWYPLPLRRNNQGKNYFISDNEFLNLPTKKTKNKSTVLSLILFNLIIDERLKKDFTIEECIDVLLGNSRTGKQTTLETYIELFNETLPRWYSKELNELKKILEYSQKEKWMLYFEKFSTALTGILETSIAIINKKKWHYSFEIKTLTNESDDLIQSKEKIEETIGNGLILIKMMEAFNEGKQQPDKAIYIAENKKIDIFKTIITGNNVQGNILFNEIYTQKNYEPSKRNSQNFKELTKKRWIDCSRLYAIDPSNDISEYEIFINKFWNASRFISQQIHQQKWAKKTKVFDQIGDQLQKKINKLTEFETRIIYKTAELQKEYAEMLEKNEIEEILAKTIHFVKDDFCDKYLEIQKYQENENEDKVTIRCLGSILKLLHPFIPYITQQIRNIIGLEWPILTQTNNNSFDKINKNYRTQLFVDIIDKLLEQKKQAWFIKHESVEICFFAPLDFLQYLRSQEKTISKLINAGAIEYIDNEKQLAQYMTQTIINITIGIKAKNKITTPQKTESLSEIIAQKEQEIQRIRTMITSLSASGADADLIRQKKKEMDKLKKEIEELQLQLQKQKTNK